MKQDISNEIEKIISYCKSKECDECKYRANDDLCNLHNPTAWNVNQMNEKEAIEELKSLSPSESAIETVLNLIEKKDNAVRNIVQRLENDIKNITKTKADGKHSDYYSRNRLKAYKTKTKEIKEYIEKQYFNKKIEKGE